jgi:hypothetical protein
VSEEWFLKPFALWINNDLENNRPVELRMGFKSNGFNNYLLY